MKKILFILLSFLLFGCVDSNIIEVKHSSDFTSELIGEIELQSDKSNHNTNAYDINILSINDYLDDDVTSYLFHLDTKVIETVEYSSLNQTLVNQDQEYIVYDEQYKITRFSKYETTFESSTFYYEKDGVQTKLYEYVMDYSSGLYSSIDFNYFSYDGDFHFFIKENDAVIDYIVEDASLKEVKRIPIVENGYTLVSMYQEKEGICFKYENEEKLRYVLNDEELILVKNENGKELISYAIQGITPKQLTYNNKGMIQLHLEDKIYDLGYNAKYQIRDDYILSTGWKEDKLEKETKLILRDNKKVYVLSEYYDMSEYFYLSSHIYLSKDTSKDNNVYSFLIIDGLDVTAIELPFTEDFEFVYAMDNDSFIFEYREGNIVQIYQVDIK